MLEGTNDNGRKKSHLTNPPNSKSQKTPDLIIPFAFHTDYYCYPPPASPTIKPGTEQKNEYNCGLWVWRVIRRVFGLVYGVHGINTIAVSKRRDIWDMAFYYLPFWKSVSGDPKMFRSSFLFKREACLVLLIIEQDKEWSADTSSKQLNKLVVDGRAFPSSTHTSWSRTGKAERIERTRKLRRMLTNILEEDISKLTKSESVKWKVKILNFPGKFKK